MQNNILEDKAKKREGSPANSLQTVLSTPLSIIERGWGRLFSLFSCSFYFILLPLHC